MLETNDDKLLGISWKSNVGGKLSLFKVEYSPNCDEFYTICSGEEEEIGVKGLV